MATTRWKGNVWKNTWAWSKARWTRNSWLSLYKSQGKRTNIKTVWLKQHPLSIRTSPVRYCLSSNIPLPLTKWKYRFTLLELTRQCRSYPILRMGHCQRIATLPIGWRYSLNVSSWWGMSFTKRVSPIHIWRAWSLTKQTMSWGKYTKEYTGTSWGHPH